MSYNIMKLQLLYVSYKLIYPLEIYNFSLWYVSGDRDRVIVLLMNEIINCTSIVHSIQSRRGHTEWNSVSKLNSQGASPDPQIEPHSPPPYAESV